MGVPEYPTPYRSSNNKNNTINTLPTQAIDRERNGKAQGLAKKIVDKWEGGGERYHGGNSQDGR